MWKQALLLLGCVGACARPGEYAAPAPAGALECALREAEELGYQRMEGEPDERFTRVAQRLRPPPAEPVRGRDPAIPGAERQNRDAPTENQLLLRTDRGRLQIQVVSLAEGGDRLQPSSTAQDHAQLILAQCTAPGTP